MSSLTKTVYYDTLRFKCPKCGGDLVLHLPPHKILDRGKVSLKCDYCGAVLDVYPFMGPKVVLHE